MTQELDPGMKEIIDDFCKEARGLLLELEDVLSELEVNPTDTKKLEQFGQVIDRIMGAAKSIGSNDIAQFCELGKLIGYKSSQIHDRPLLEVVVAVLFDSVDLLQKMVDSLQTGNAKVLAGLNTQAFVKRLKWLSEKFQNIERASCKLETEDEKQKLTQGSIDDLLASLGL